MALKNRLSRLSGGLSSPGRVSSDPSEAAALQAGPRSPVDLDALRAKMATMLGKPHATLPPFSHEAPPPGLPQALPFLAWDTPHGVVQRRLQPQPASHVVGRLGTQDAWRADAKLLSLLALSPGLAELDVRRVLFFDTETTGLGGAGTVAFLVGLAWFDSKGALHLEQLLLGSPSEEPALLWRVRELFESASLLVSFNGKSFDLPLLSSRCVMNRQGPMPLRPHLDLLHVARRVHKRRLARFSLKSLELEVLGFERSEDDIPGAEIPPIWGHFLRTGEAEQLLGVVEHNRSDVLTMAALLGLYGEPLAELCHEDLLGVAETLGRAGDYNAALGAVERAFEGEGSPEALRVRGRLHKARGDKAAALVDFETFSERCANPEVRLVLAKLYEHFAKDYRKALAVVARGTTEGDLAMERRRERLARKSAKGDTGR